MAAVIPGVDMKRARAVGQQNVVLASLVVHDPLPVKYSCAVSAVSPAGQEEVPDGSISVEE
jgi:hypothetical protein